MPGNRFRHDFGYYHLVFVFIIIAIITGSVHATTGKGEIAVSSPSDVPAGMSGDVLVTMTSDFKTDTGEPGVAAFQFDIIIGDVGVANWGGGNTGISKNVDFISYTNPPITPDDISKITPDTVRMLWIYNGSTMANGQNILATIKNVKSLKSDGSSTSLNLKNVKIFDADGKQIPSGQVTVQSGTFTTAGGNTVRPGEGLNTTRITSVPTTVMVSGIPTSPVPATTEAVPAVTPYPAPTEQQPLLTNTVTQSQPAESFLPVSQEQGRAVEPTRSPGFSIVSACIGFLFAGFLIFRRV